MNVPCTADAILGATFSKPSDTAFADKLKLRKTSADSFSADYFKGPKAFRDEWKSAKVDAFLADAEKQFHAITIETADKTITVLTSRKGKTTVLVKGRKTASASPATAFTKAPHNRVKNYILPEGESVPFLVKLGVMTAEGKVHAQKYDKFRQINRFLEFVDDILSDIVDAHEDAFPGTPLRIIDFGCGKSYLTFAVYHYLVVKKGIQAEIFGLDLKKDVIEDCAKLAAACGYDGLRFACGDIADYRAENAGQGAPLDLVITLHACDTATDYALAFAVEHGARAILSVPCCQHELNTALGRTAPDEALNPLLKYGIVKERFSALATDVIRAETLSAHGYKTQLLEFIDMEHTPKNILIRAIKREDSAPDGPLSAAETADKASSAYKAGGADALKSALGVELTLERLLRQ